MIDRDPHTIWRDFCRDLEQAGAPVFSADLAVADIDKAEGIRYLTRLLRIGLEMHLEHADPAFPRFYAASHESAKIGSDNPDNFYLNATISGAHSYRIRGTRGTVPILSFGTKANRYEIDGTMASTGELDVRDMDIDAKGNFEIIASREKQPGNWLPLAKDSSMLLVRQTFFDRQKKTPARVNIETINGPKTPNNLGTEALARMLARVPAFINGTSATFRHWAEQFRAENRNTLNTSDQSLFLRAGGDPMIFYLHGWWELAEGEALKITSGIPKCEGWNFQINNVWMESLDSRYHCIHYNNASAKPNADGSITLIVSHEKPDAENWIETCGHRRGTMLWRWTGAKEHPVPDVKVIKQ